MLHFAQLETGEEEVHIDQANAFEMLAETCEMIDPKEAVSASQSPGSLRVFWAVMWC